LETKWSRNRFPGIRKRKLLILGKQLVTEQVSWDTKTKAVDSWKPTDYGTGFLGYENESCIFLETNWLRNRFPGIRKRKLLILGNQLVTEQVSWDTKTKAVDFWKPTGYGTGFLGYEDESCRFLETNWIRTGFLGYENESCRFLKTNWLRNRFPGIRNRKLLILGNQLVTEQVSWDTKMKAVDSWKPTGYETRFRVNEHSTNIS
jgi:hypothetical protein